MLLKDQHLLVRVFEQAPIGMALLSLGDSFRVNSSLCDMLGYTEHELLNLGVDSVTHPDDIDTDRELWNKLVQGEIDNYKIEKRYIHKSGDIKWGLLHITVERYQQGISEHDIYIAQVVDITDSKIKEETIREAEKLSMVGELAAGIAHEIRNPLTSLRGFVQMYKNEDIHGKNQLRNDVMLGEIDRINEIVSELLVLSKPENKTYRLGNIIEKLNHVVTLFEGQANLYNIRIKIEFNSDLPLIYCHGSLQQAFINILKNAIEAMPHGGEVLIKIIKIDTGIQISFTDQGYGISQNQLEKIFQPFFTTKETGTGLGLMVSKRIIQNHNGKMRIESKIGNGTTVEIVLPTPLK
ncbi:MAG TPA: ATP-binding protein [Bacillota bacterium]|nr:ATP-binding protein [Bacillota bacterium]